jgi:hemoglobin
MPDIPLQPGVPSPSPADSPFNAENTPYDAIGGEPAVRALADAFYDRMLTDAPRVRALHDENLADIRQKFFEFLSGWLGGPQLYMTKHGHPRLRMRHNPFPIDHATAAEWVHCMQLAMNDREITGPVRAFLDERFAHVANFLVNR